MGTFYQEDAKNRVLNQLRESPNYMEIIRLIAQDFDSISDIHDYLAGVNVYTATGHWLDLIGYIVGQSRAIDITIPVYYFGFQGQQNTTGFEQARMYNGEEPTVETSTLGDDEYRTIIIARVAKNYGDVSIPGVITALQNIVNDSDVALAEMGNASFRVYIGATLEDNTKQLLSSIDIIPRAAGVFVNGLYYQPREKTFGFRDQNFQGFGAGLFAEEIN